MSISLGGGAISSWSVNLNCLVRSKLSSFGIQTPQTGIELRFDMSQ